VRSDAPLYLDAAATTPLGEAARSAMADAERHAWANPSSLHGFGLAAAESLERSRARLATALGTHAEAVRFCSGATESIHLALLGTASRMPPSRLLISAVEHPAVLAAAAQLAARGWQVVTLPVDSTGVVSLRALEALLEPPTRLVSVIWGQSEVGTVQPLEAIGLRCRQAGVVFHTDAVQVAPHLPIDFEALPVDLLSLTAHKLEGPRGVGALLLKSSVGLAALQGGGGQERGLRAGTEPVVLAAGFAAALEGAVARQRSDQRSDQRSAQRSGHHSSVQQQRDALLGALLELPGVQLSGPHPQHQPRLPHHISLWLRGSGGRPLDGRQLVRALWQEGVACSSGSACRSGAAGHASSPVLVALGLSAAEAAAGVRFTLGPWLSASDLERVPAALQRAMEAC